MSVWVLTSSSGYPEDGGHEVHGLYRTLEACFREVARYCKGNSSAYGPEPGESKCTWVTRARVVTNKFTQQVWWNAEERGVQP